MDAEKLFKVLNGSYHDGALNDAKFKNGALFLYCFRNPFDPDKKDDQNYRYVIVRFDKVTDLQVYDWNSRSFVDYTEGDFDKNEDSDAITGIDYLDYEDGFVVFGQCIRFRANDLELLAHSNDELDLIKYM